MVSIYLLIEPFFNAVELDEPVDENAPGYTFGYEAGRFIKSYLKYLWLFNIVTLSLISRLFFEQRNLVEHLTIHAFIVGHISLLGAISFPITRIPLVVNPLVYLVMIVMIFVVYRKYLNPYLAALTSIFIVVLGILLFILIPSLFIILR